ncbi:MAG: TonB-linked SusC/RagA family outer membrane protein [Marinoscillum sp.]|jgi:TonB-linked SusC/RagA family outer membrane protein
MFNFKQYNMKRILLLSFMFFFVCAFSAMAQRTVSGNVTDDSGETVPGVNVILKGTTTGTTTDLDGNYRLSVPEDGATLVYSFIGLSTKEIAVGARSVLDVGMASDVQQLTEVVVTGFGIERAPNEVTYQTEKIDSKLLTQGQQQNVAQGLAGKVAGLQINIQDNGVNPQTQILLRGFRSISNNNQAMVVIDGAVASLGAFNNLNPQDIESIDVIKGANAGALYGSRAANGAVIVTTKKGRKGKGFTAGINTSLTFETVAYMPDFQSENGIGWDGAYDPIENTNWGPRFDGVQRQIGPNFPEGYVLDEQMTAYAPIQDNLRDFYETGQTFQNTAYFSGGDETGSFYMSLGNVQTEGIVMDDEYERNTIRVNASKKLGKLKLDLSSSFFTDKTDVVGGSIGDQGRPLYWFVLNTPANIPLSSYKDWDNIASYAHSDNYYNAYYQNPYWGIGTNRNTDETNRLVANMSGAYDVTDNINVSARLGVDRNAGTGRQWRDAQAYNGDIQCCHQAVTSFMEDSEFQRTEVNGNALISGNFNITEDISIKPILGASFIGNSFRGSIIRANNLSIPGFYDVSNGTGIPVVGVNESEKRTYGFFADVTFGFRDWLYLNLAGRQDYTSTLPANDNGYFYPAASLSAILSEAIPSLTDGGILSFAKITLSNATVYNDLDVYALNERFSQGRGGFPFPYGSVNGFEVAGTAVDANISKEKLNTWELGVNLAFLNDRFTLDGSVYNQVTTDLITNTTPSVASGASAFLTNIGQMTTKGMELTLGGNILKVGGFEWNANINYTTYESVIDEIRADIEEIAVANYGGYGVFAIVGEAFPQLKAQSYARDPQGRVIVDAGSGDPVLGEVTPQGKTTPDYIIGVSSSMSFKGFSLAATMDYRTGHVYYEQGSDAMEFTGRSQESVSANRENFVFPNSVIEVGDGVFVENTNLPVSNGRMGFWQNAYNDIKENYVKDATALKIRELSFSYTLPPSVINKVDFLSKVTVGFVGRNLWTQLPEENRFSDPEFQNQGGSDNGVGVGGYFTSPPTRSFGFNLNVEF